MNRTTNFNGENNEPRRDRCAACCQPDAAAGALLVREAGGFVCDFEGGDKFLETNQVIAGNAAVSSQLAKVLAPHAT